jgi:DNA-directed RNA polymerase specialized sigma subunit
MKYTNSQGITLSRGMSKEALNEMCSTLNLNEIETKIMFKYYVERKSLQYIANNVGYSIDNVKKIKAKIIKRIND